MSYCASNWLTSYKMWLHSHNLDRSTEYAENYQYNYGHVILKYFYSIRKYLLIFFFHWRIIRFSFPDRGSSVERELTSTTTSDDDVLVYHAYSHISDGEGGHPTSHAKKKLRYRNGRGRYRSADHPCPTSSQSSSELSSPNETCYSFVRRAFQKLSSSASTAGSYDSYSRKSNPRPYFYRSCRKPCISDSMEFGVKCKNSRPSSPRNEFQHQVSRYSLEKKKT